MAGRRFAGSSSPPRFSARRLQRHGGGRTILRVSAFKVTGGVPSFTFPTVSGYKYRVVYKNGLTDPTWLEVAPGFVISTGANMTVTDPGAAGQPHRFYRLEAANP
jgi:hypothetical protein